jgi:hypothetical protein
MNAQPTLPEQRPERQADGTEHCALELGLGSPLYGVADGMLLLGPPENPA